MPALPRTRKTRRTSLRLTDEAVAMADELAKAWGPVSPLSFADVVIESLRIAKEQETRKRKLDQK